MQKTEIRSILSPYSSINSKWIKDLNIRLESLKILQERTETTLEAIDRGRTSSLEIKGSETKRKNWQMGLHEIKKLLHNKRNGL
jgi:hypothetical protein